MSTVFRYTISQPGESTGLNEMRVLCEDCATQRIEQGEYLRKHEDSPADPRLPCIDCGETN